MWYTLKSRKGSKSIKMTCNHCKHSFPITTASGTATYWKKNGIEQADSCPHCGYIEMPVIQPAAREWQSMDISSGIGIGGFGSDDYNIWTEHDTISHPERDGCKWGGTRYDEQCAKCRRITAICNDCELCENCHE